jgi:predicted lipoprotein with Yx(FWY)xxD motif
VKRTLPTIAVLALAAVLAIAGCGGNDSNSNSSPGGAYRGGGGGSSKPTGGSGGGTAAVVSAAGVGKLGRVIVDSKGLTLYDFHKDKGAKSSCYGGCASVWPPLTTGGAPKAGEGATASQLGTTKRSDGTVQVTYAGHPLYTYTADAKPGDAKGNDIDSFGAQWYALKPNGEEPEG